MELFGTAKGVIIGICCDAARVERSISAHKRRIGNGVVSVSDGEEGPIDLSVGGGGGGGGGWG